MADQDQDRLVAVAYRVARPTPPPPPPTPRFASPNITLPDARLVAQAQAVHSEAVAWMLADYTDPDDPLTDLLWSQAMDHPAIAALYTYEYATQIAERRLRDWLRALIGED
jgi:hypothetical protein